MGYYNNHLIGLCEKARKRGWKEVEALGRLVDKSQAECPHPMEDRRIRELTQSFGKYKKGGRHEWCIRCSKLLHYTPPPEHVFKVKR